MLNEKFITMILAAGGIGSRMGLAVPKQYLPLAGKPIALHSFDLFCSMEEVDEIIVVCQEPYRKLFFSSRKPLFFADPGKKRQDSIFNGLSRSSKRADLICTHDAARPFIEKEVFLALLEKGLFVGAATLAAPVICTIKQSDANHIVEKTLDRSSLWEIQTPQALRKDLFLRGFEYANENKIDVTDDVSLAELLQAPVALVPSPHRNFKITTPFDLAVANTLYH